ncbi:hypothetical protein BLA29_013011 [Euroglyphus maynei]|uniref:Uncharacterized protein n=1 Tax=Euroglyphus maynei TaxID=6958 RepID=A0A1Y3BI42_EURMA|nr:hypothetical protein BLA29_013011 [Euroglyphus maynei]
MSKSAVIKNKFKSNLVIRPSTTFNFMDLTPPSPDLMDNNHSKNMAIFSNDNVTGGVDGDDEKRILQPKSSTIMPSSVAQFQSE